jgi:hypothetical protein
LIKDLKIRPEASTEKSREYTGSNRYGKDFLRRTQLSQQLRERIDKYDYMTLKSFCTFKLKRVHREWERSLCQIYIR